MQSTACMTDQGNDCFASMSKFFAGLGLIDSLVCSAWRAKILASGLVLSPYSPQETTRRVSSHPARHSVRLLWRCSDATFPVSIMHYGVGMWSLWSSIEPPQLIAWPLPQPAAKPMLQLFVLPSAAVQYAPPFLPAHVAGWPPASRKVFNASDRN